MKKTWVIILLILGAFLPAVCGCTVLAEERKLTLMVYMCGSNLESEYGSATSDILEMESSGFSADDITVLVMMGGAGNWKINPGSDQTVIMEVGPGRQRIVWRSEQLNMGSSETLTQLLQFAREKYPAEDYALILWDHGGGPLEGVCWDELFSMDSLTLDELTKGIKNSFLHKKLCWIGFDACLMGSAEVAAAIAPYAEYMIASQETEPAAGWNYAFLKDAGRDGAATGRRIIDCYFDALSDSQDPLTMACIDLSKIDQVIAELDAFFPPINESVSDVHFTELSRIRAASSGFGKSVRAVGADGYDLVDLSDLIVRYGGEDSPVMQALLDAVTYSRSKNTESGGLSVYHPYANKKKYLESWRNDYRLLKFSSEYTRYLEHFGAILTGDEFVDWSGLTPVHHGVTEDGEQMISLQLTEEQAGHYLTGEMLTMVNFSRTEGVLSLAPISASPVSMDGNGSLTAGYRGRALYAVDADGEILSGPISFMMTEDGEYYLILAVYHDYSAKTDTRDDMAVLHYCRLNENTGEVRIVRSYVYDRASRTYTNRIAFSQDGFTRVEFRYFIRNLPDTKKAIPGFEDWTLYGGYMAHILDLPCDWHLRFLDNWNSSDIYAVFQLTDVQQNHWSSIPVRISNPRDKQIEVTQTLPETEGIGIVCSAMIHATTQYPYLQIKVDITNDTDQTLSFSGTRLILNGTRNTDDYVWIYDVEAGKTGSDTCSLDTKDLIGLNRLRSVDFVLSVSVSGEYGTEPTLIPVHLELENGELGLLSSAAPHPLDEYDDGDITWQLISMRQEEDGSLTGMIHVLNHGDTELQTGCLLLVNDVQTDAQVSVRLAPGTDAYYSFKYENRADLSSMSLHVAGTDRLYLLGVNQALEQAGLKEADQLNIYPGQSYSSSPEGIRRISLRLPESIALQEPESVPEPVELMSGDGILVLMEQLLIGDDGVGIGLRLENNTDETIYLEMLNAELNGTAYDRFSFHPTVTMPPHTKAVKCIKLQDSNGFTAGTPAESMSFRFREGNRLSEPVVLRFPDGTVFGAPGGTMLTGKELSVTAVAFGNKPMAFSESAAVSDQPFRPLTVTAPMTPEEAARLESGNVSLCIVSHEKSRNPDSPVYIVHREISRISLEQAGETWTAVLSGAAVIVEDYFLTTWEDRLADNSWRLNPGNVYFYPEAGSCQPTGGSLLFDGGGFVYSDTLLTVENADGHLSVTDFRASLSSWGVSDDSRTNRYLEEIAEAALETRVFFGTNRPVNYGTLDYYETHMLSLEEPVTLTLVPYDTLVGDQCLYYALFFTDGSRKDILQDLETGEILDETFMPANDP